MNRGPGRNRRDTVKMSFRYVQWHDDVIKWKHFPRHWPLVRGLHRSPVNSPHKGQWRGALMFPLICVWINGWVNNREACDSRRYRAHYDVTVMIASQIARYLGPAFTKRGADRIHVGPMWGQRSLLSGIVLKWETDNNKPLNVVIFCLN